MVDSIGINTGHNYLTGAQDSLITTAQDPNWQITYLSPGIISAYGTLPAVPFNAYTSSSWSVTQPGSEWLSFASTSDYITTTSDTLAYIMIVSKQFKTCIADSIQFDISLLNDNSCSLITVDSIPIPVGHPFYQNCIEQTGDIDPSPFTNPASLTAKLSLAPGTHTLSFSIVNAYVAGLENPQGIDVVGTIKSTTNTASIVGPASPVGCSCLLSVTSEIASQGNSLYQNTPNSFNNETLIGYDVEERQQSAFITVHDISGKELLRYPISKKGKGSITVNSDKLSPGMYIYTLVVDGKEIDNKKMTLLK